MTAQAHEYLILNGEKTSMDCIPGIPEKHPQIVCSDIEDIDLPCPNCGQPLRIITGRQGKIIACSAYPFDKFKVGLTGFDKEGILGSSACWRGYIATWEIKDGKFYLCKIDGRYALVAVRPILADWFTGYISVPSGFLVDVHDGYESIYTSEIYIWIENGLVVDQEDFDNSPNCNADAYNLMIKALHVPKEETERKIALFKAAETLSSGFYDLLLLGRHVFDELDDATWVKRIYTSAFKIAEESTALLDLEWGIRNDLGDFIWANEVLINAINFAVEEGGSLDELNPYEKRLTNIRKTDDIRKIADCLILNCSADTFIRVVPSALFLSIVKQASSTQDDNETLVMYSEIMNRCQTGYTLILLAEEVFDCLNDEDFAISLYHKSESLLSEYSEYMLLASSISERTRDSMWKRQIYGKAENRLHEEANESNRGSILKTTRSIELAAAIVESLDDQEWATRIYQQILDSGSGDDREVAKAVSTTLRDKAWGRKLFQPIVDEYKNQWPSDLYKLGIDIGIDLSDADWARDIYQFSENVLSQNLNDSYRARELIFMAKDIVITLGDVEWAKRIYSKVNTNDDILAPTNPIRELADAVIESERDPLWGDEILKESELLQKRRERKFAAMDDVIDLPLNGKSDASINYHYKTKEDNAKSVNDLIDLGEELTIDDHPEWAISIFNKASKMATESEDICRLASMIESYASLEGYLDKRWVKTILFNSLRYKYRKNPKISRWLRRHS